MRISARKIIILAVVANMAIVAAVIFRHRGNQHSLAAAELKQNAPKLQGRLAGQIAQLESESTKESLARLAQVDWYFWPGPKSEGGFVAIGVPLSKETGQRDLEAIGSNRRFSKIFAESASMDRAVLSRMVSDELARGIEAYLKLYADEMQRLAPIYKKEKLIGQASYSGPTFVTGGTKDEEVVIVGLRLKILALVALSGTRNLSECKPHVERVVRIALLQRQELYEDASVVSPFKSEMLKWASLYNRQILGCALLQLSLGASDQTLTARDVGLSWSETQLASFKAVLTEFDLPVRSGLAPADNSLGNWPIRFLNPLDDAQFDHLVKRCGLTP